jgi:putative membrane protein
LVVAVVGLLGATYRRFPFSTPSYVSIFCFLAIHALGAHYTYSEMPLGLLMQEVLGLTRNHYDRVVHFVFGLLFAYPARELVSRTTALHGLGCSVAAFVLIVALSASYELAEWWVALIVSPDAAHAYLGTQGDVFDAQKDMMLAFAGAVIALAAIAAWPRRESRDP